jgi:hypothetical protein
MKPLTSKPTLLIAVVAAALISCSSIAAAQEQESRKDQSQQASRSAASGNTDSHPWRMETGPGEGHGNGVTRRITIRRDVQVESKGGERDQVARVD